MNRSNLWNAALVASILAVAGGLWRAGSSAAYANRAAPACCVAVIDLNMVLTSMDERKAREQELQDYIATLESPLRDMQAKVGQGQDDLKILPEKSPDWYTKREETAKLAMRLRAEGEVSKALVEDRRKQMHLALFAKINETAARYAKREGFQVIISNDSAVEIPQEAPENQVQAAMVGRRVIHADASVDISQAVAQMMNNEFKAR